MRINTTLARSFPLTLKREIPLQLLQSPFPPVFLYRVVILATLIFSESNFHSNSRNEMFFKHWDKGIIALQQEYNLRLVICKMAARS